MCNRLTKLSVTMSYTFFGIFDDTSLWILPKMHDLSLCNTLDDYYKQLYTEDSKLLYYKQLYTEDSKLFYY